MQTLLTVAGTDATSGAGVTADVLVFNDFGFHGLWVPTALLDQDTRTVHDLRVRDPAAVSDMLARALRVGSPAAIKIGLLGSGAMAQAVANVLAEEAGAIPIVIDPVLASGLGRELADARLVSTLEGRLLPLSAVVTPNAPEAAALVGAPVTDAATARSAAARLLRSGVGAVLVKGGHLPGAPGDILATDQSTTFLPNTQRFPADVHGTGCHLSSAIAALLASGFTIGAAVVGARHYLAGCMASLGRLGGETQGRPVIAHGPLTRRAASRALEGPGPAQ